MAAPSIPTDSEFTIQKATELFKQQLINWEREKLPYKLTESLEQAQSASEQATSRIFINTGFSSWLAYFLAWNKCNGKNYKGQSNERQVLDAFDLLALNSRQAVAVEISNAETHSNVQLLIDRFRVNLKRRRESAAFFKLRF